MNDIIFICNTCGKEHAAVPPTTPDFTPEEMAQRRAAWLEADQKLSKSPHNSHLEKDYMKAWFHYSLTLASTGSGLPDTITTIKKGNQHFFVCVDHEQEKEKHTT
jgi:hypothetical protein